MNATQLLDRLHTVRQTGPGRWLAKCPAHEDRTPSLSIREMDDGRILIHDFGGCEVSEVLAAVGLDFSDLYPKRSNDHSRSPAPTRIPASDALVTIDHEAHVVAVIGADVLEHRELDRTTWDRLAQAVRQIGETRAMVCPARNTGPSGNIGRERQ